MIVKKSPKQLSASRKLSILLALMEDRLDLNEHQDLSAPEMRSFRDFLLAQIIHVAEKGGDRAITAEGTQRTL